eukprot:1184987-Prorocentrum_minimum.AAC.1
MDSLTGGVDSLTAGVDSLTAGVDSLTGGVDSLSQVALAGARVGPVPFAAGVAAPTVLRLGHGVPGVSHIPLRCPLPRRRLLAGHFGGGSGRGNSGGGHRRRLFSPTSRNITIPYSIQMYSKQYTGYGTTEWMKRGPPMLDRARICGSPKTLKP